MFSFIIYSFLSAPSVPSCSNLCCAFIWYSPIIGSVVKSSLPIIDPDGRGSGRGGA